MTSTSLDAGAGEATTPLQDSPGLHFELLKAAAPVAQEAQCGSKSPALGRPTARRCESGQSSVFCLGNTTPHDAHRTKSCWGWATAEEKPSPWPMRLLKQGMGDNTLPPLAWAKRHGLEPKTPAQLASLRSQRALFLSQRNLEGLRRKAGKSTHEAQEGGKTDRPARCDGFVQGTAPETLALVRPGKDETTWQPFHSTLLKATGGYPVGHAPECRSSSEKPRPSAFSSAPKPPRATLSTPSSPTHRPGNLCPLLKQLRADPNYYINNLPGRLTFCSQRNKLRATGGRLGRHAPVICLTSEKPRLSAFYLDSSEPGACRVSSSRLSVANSGSLFHVVHKARGPAFLHRVRRFPFFTSPTFHTGCARSSPGDVRGLSFQSGKDPGGSMTHKQAVRITAEELRRRNAPFEGGQGRTGEDVKNDAEAILLVFLLVFASIAWALCCGGGAQP